MASNIDESQDDDAQEQQLRGKKASSHKLKRYDSLNLKPARCPMLQIVLGSSFRKMFLAALSLILYTITLIPVVKCVFIVHQANDNGDGGTFALYSLICRYSKVGLIPSTMAEDKEVSTFKLDLPDRRTRRATEPEMLENSEFANCIGIYNFSVYDPSIARALNPMYIIAYFEGTERMLGFPFELRHYLQMLVILVSIYTAKCYILANVWPAVLAAIIASQALISATFAIVQQSLALGCFPRVKIVTEESSAMLMLKATCWNLIPDRIAVVFVMFLTSSFLVLVMIMIWKTPTPLIIAYVAVIGSIELLYLSSVLYKFNQGGYLPLAFSMFLMLVITRNPTNLQALCRRMCLLYTLSRFPSVKSLPISKVPVEERFLFRRVKPYDLYVFRCVVRYGYADYRTSDEGPLRKYWLKAKGIHQ
ncbi:hypothetical protein HAX54_032403 [Datura stramonium]|uniref:K+ potassium transporter integral membrane domain-containing protein n=1 Tax=Datura stramonium TaxID=4076 RepID=A0ABS8SCL1_DATST|nr:hypothetical protein [Datura stramonium]